MLSAFVVLAAALTVSAQTPPFPDQTVLKPGLNGSYSLTAEGISGGSLDGSLVYYSITNCM